MDGNSISLIIAAVAAALVTLGGLGMNIITFIDGRKIRRAQDELKLASIRRDTKLAEIAVAVNGQSERAVAAARVQGQLEGHMQAQRGDPPPLPAAPQGGA